MSEPGFRLDIQGLRGIAVLLVVLAHASVSGFAGGFIGVDVFFVISGYVITGLLLRLPARRVRENLRYFYIRRILRILPAATLVLIATPLVAVVILGEYFDPELLTDVRWASWFSANFRLINTSADYFMQGVDPSLLTHFWSLAVEEQFYFIYPLIVFALTWLGREAHRLPILRGFLALSVASSAGWALVQTFDNRVAAYYSPFTRFWELALGGLVATLPLAWAKRSSLAATLAGISGAALLVFALFVIRPDSAFPGYLAWLPCLASALLLWSGQGSTPTARLLAVKPLQFVGDLSYSLYLWHYLWLFLPQQLDVPLNSPSDRLLQIAGAFGCALASYYLVENPIRHNRRLQRDGVAVALLLIVGLALAFDATLLAEQMSFSFNQ